MWNNYIFYFRQKQYTETEAQKSYVCCTNMVVVFENVVVKDKTESYFLTVSTTNAQCIVIMTKPFVKFIF